tara:strand:+ start:162 stop:497 length:336 start_codon:yes stop_codon:yes gene_type:complete
MKKIIQLFFISLILISCSKESAENRECELENIGYIDITNADNEPYYMYIDDIFTQTLSSEYYLNDYEISVGTHSFRFVEVNAIIPNVDTYTFYVEECEHYSIIFGENDPLK